MPARTEIDSYLLSLMLVSLRTTTTYLKGSVPLYFRADYLKGSVPLYFYTLVLFYYLLATQPRAHIGIVDYLAAVRLLCLIH